MIAYKLTNQDGTTYGGCQWGEGVEHEASGEGDLCGPGWIHAYEHPLLAVLHNPIHGAFADPLLWECKASGEIKRDGQMKFGSTRLRTIKRIEAPNITLVQRIAYGILAAKAVYRDSEWAHWADDWLAGKDRSVAAADAAAEAAAAEAWARAEAWAAEAAARAAAEAWAAEAWAAWAAEAAAAAAEAWAAEAAAAAAEAIDLIAIAEQAMTTK